MWRRILCIFLYITLVTTSTIGVQKLFPELKKQYIYIFKSNISSGVILPAETGTHWTMESKLTIQVFNYTRIRCRLEDIKTSVFDKVQAYPSELPPEAAALKNEWEVIYQATGTVYSVHLPQGEPLWSSNIKRAISLNLQLQEPEGSNELSFNVNEPCLYGICTVEYTSVDGKTIRKLQDIPTSEPGLGRYMWRSVPFDSCVNRNSKQSLIGSAERVYRLNEKGLNELELSSVLQYHSHNHLLAVTTEMSLNFDKDSVLGEESRLQLISSYPGYFQHYYKEPTNGRLIKSQELLFNDTKQILLKISKGIDVENIVRNSSLIHNLDFIDLQKTMSQLDYEWLMKLYEELAVGTSYDIETCKNLYLEALPHVKTSSGALFVKYLVVEQKNHIESSTLLSLIRKLPFNVANYSQELLDQMESFTKLGLDYPQDIKHACILSFATLAYNTFRNGGCNADFFENIVVKYFRMYTDCPQYLDRLIWLQGLSNLQVGSVYSYLAPKIINSSTNRHERYLGLLATLPTASVDPIVSTVLSWPILTNEDENIQLRVAALMQLLASGQTPGRVLAIHEYVTKSNSQQLKSFWYTTVKSLEGSTYSCFNPMAQYTSYVSKLVSSPDPRYWGTGNFIIDTSDDERNSAAMMQLITIGDPVTGLPEVVHFNVRTSQAGLVTANVAVMIKAEGVSLSLFKRLHTMDSEGLRVERLVELLKKMKVQTVNPEAVHIEIIAKVHDKTIYATHVNQTKFDSWNGNDLAQSIQSFLQFGSHINQQTIFYPLQVDFNLPTELGTPVTLETTYSSFSSIRGNLSAPSSHELTWKNDVHFRYQATAASALSAAGPAQASLHAARLQQSAALLLPLRFHVTLAPRARSLQIKWPNPGNENGGLVLHARAQIALEVAVPSHKHVYSVNADENKYAVDESGVFFDCDRPMTGVELIEKLLDSNKSNYDFFTSLRPPLIILHGIFLLSVPPSGSCGVILPPRRLLQKSGDNVLEVNVEVQELELRMEESLKIKVYHSLAFRENRDGGAVYMNLSGTSDVEAAAGKSTFSLSLLGEQPLAIDPNRRIWKLCVHESVVSPKSSEQDISPYPSAHEGNLTVSFGHGPIAQECPNDGATFVVEYKGRPSGVYSNKGAERHLVVKMRGHKLPKLNFLTNSGIGSQTAIGQLLRVLDKDSFNLTAVLKEHNGVASMSLDQGPQLHFKSDNINWMLNNWSSMQLMKKFGIYRECRLLESTVHTLTGSVDRLPPMQCAESLALADCSSTPRFALLRQQGGGYKLYTGGHYVTIEPPIKGTATVKVNDQVVDYENGYTYPKNETVYDFKITRVGESVKIHSRLSGVQLYYKSYETFILVPDTYLTVGCGACMSQHYYKLC